MCFKSTNVTRVAPAGMWSAVALWALEPPASASLRRGKPAGILRYFHFDSIPMQTMCRKSTSVTEQTLYLLRIQTVPCNSLHPFFIFKTYVPLFLFCGNAKRKSEHKKFWKRIGGAGGKERTFFKRFFLSPAGKVPQTSRETAIHV